jgi:hypothetical protein
MNVLGNVNIFHGRVEQGRALHGPLELVDDERRLLQVEVARDHYDELNPKIGEQLYVRPKKIRVFVDQP